MRYIPSWNLICRHKTYPISIDNSDPTVLHHTPVGIATRPAQSFGALTRTVLSSLLNLHMCSLSTAHCPSPPPIHTTHARNHPPMHTTDTERTLLNTCPGSPNHQHHNHANHNQHQRHHRLHHCQHHQPHQHHQMSALCGEWLNPFTEDKRSN